MRKFVILALVCLSTSLAHADRLIGAPSGRKVVYRNLRVQGLWEGDGSEYFQGYAAYGLGTAIDVAVAGESVDNHHNFPSFDMTLTLTDPIVNYVPGLAIGVQDAFDQTADGSRWYAAISYDIGMDGRYNGATPMQICLGAGVGRMNGVFVGFSIPVSNDFKLLAEHDARRISVGFEFKPARQINARWISREGQVLWSLGWSTRL